jgi:glutamine amidotransferase
MVLVATEPLTHGEPWTAFEPGELRVFADGHVRWHAVAATALA